MLAGLILIVTVGGGAVVVSLLMNFLRTAGDEDKKGMVHVVRYGQTHQRMMLLANAANMYVGDRGDYPSRVEELQAYGVDAGILWDKFGGKFRLEGDRILSAGEDSEHGTADDFWMEIPTLEMGGSYIDARGTLENLSILPPEARTAIRQAGEAQRMARRRQMEMNDAIRSAEEFDSSLYSQPQDSWDASGSSFSPSSIVDDSLYSGRESDEDF